MAALARWFAIAVSAVLQSIGGILLSIVAVILVRLVPSLAQAPPSFLSELADSRRGSIVSNRSLSSDTSDGPSEPPSPIRDRPAPDIPSPGPSTLFDSQTRPRATRQSARSPRFVLPTLPEDEDPIIRPTSAGDYGMRASSQDPFFASPMGTPEEVEMPLEDTSGLSSSPNLNRRHSFRLLPHFKLSPAPKRSKLCRCQSMPSELNSLSTPPKRKPPPIHRSTWNTSHSEREHGSKWRLVSPKHHKPRTPATAPMRTNPYEAPYFFPTPESPDAQDYVRRVRMDLKNVEPILISASSSRAFSNTSLLPDSGSPTKVTFAPLRRAASDVSSARW
ncbi:hypothetical protein BV25DRAFT_1835549 [Artomyces pyxidatus]|uniref:Uncharacterized protein n=1 Tax=Artomyces pyxidatus TaxID=48021 RepID=A0ACB8TDL6_9AGAM|nr:hypothetical protein BV25DRAFT_1835549 [Artomyces pyxidatus]